VRQQARVPAYLKGVNSKIKKQLDIHKSMYRSYQEINFKALKELEEPISYRKRTLEEEQELELERTDDYLQNSNSLQWKASQNQLQQKLLS